MKNILFKRPMITIFLFYAFFLIALDCLNFFSPQNQSFLYHFAQYNKPVIIEGKVISDIEYPNNNSRFTLKTFKINGLPAKEKVLVTAPNAYKISYGDIISIEGKLSTPQKADFPLIFDYQNFLARNSVYTLMKVSSFEFIQSHPNPIMKFALSLQRDVVKKIDTYFKKDYADILKPVVIGDKSSLDRQTKDIFTDAGLMHILVVSGLNVGFIGGLVLIILKLFGIPLKKAFLLTIPFVFLYVLATGANPPVLRAGIMFSCVLLSLSLDREPLIYNSLALSALLILIFQPQQLFSASFQMSYLATIGIVYFYNYIYVFFAKIKSTFLKSLCGVFAVTISAQILLIPICMYYFGKVSLISIVSNIVVVPIIGIITSLGFIFYIFTLIIPFIAKLISIALSLLLYIVLISTTFFGQIKYASVPVAKPHILSILLFYLFTFSLTHFKAKKRLIFTAIVLILTLIYILIPKIYQKDKLYFNAYQGKNISTIHFKQNQTNIFILNQNTNYYDHYYINSFKQFLSFAGIKKPTIYAVGFNKDKLTEDLSPHIPLFIEAKTTTVKFHINQTTITANLKHKTYI